MKSLLTIPISIYRTKLKVFFGSVNDCCKAMKKDGVPDCYWNDICGKPIPMRQGILYSDKRNQFRKVNVPVWSVGRLIEICLKCSTFEQRQVRFFCNGDDDEYSLIDYVITALESGVMTNHMDFSKLEGGI